MTMMGCPFRRRRASLVLFTHLLLLGLLPIAEVMHGHLQSQGVELHNSGNECGHEAYHDKCSLLRVGSVPALPAPQTSLVSTAAFIESPFTPTSPVGLPGESASPALPRAPPTR